MMTEPPGYKSSNEQHDEREYFERETFNPPGVIYVIKTIQTKYLGKYIWSLLSSILHLDLHNQISFNTEHSDRESGHFDQTDDPKDKHISSKGMWREISHHPKMPRSNKCFSDCNKNKQNRMVTKITIHERVTGYDTTSSDEDDDSQKSRNQLRKKGKSANTSTSGSDEDYSANESESDDDDEKTYERDKKSKTKRNSAEPTKLRPISKMHYINGSGQNTDHTRSLLGEESAGMTEAQLKAATKVLIAQRAAILEWGRTMIWAGIMKRLRKKD